MSAAPVSAEKQQALKARMAELGLREEDIEERFIHGGGRGGQKLNKTASCVWLKHLPSGLEVKCQQERSQSLNRFFARRLLVAKYERDVLGLSNSREQRIRKQKKRRRRRSTAADAD
ncbi:MAG: Peptide chain release factor 1 [Deltaproteobacteria bacterium ADurb.Bin510]|nr:MAG: Peptide chain release factor 1 [Deltaproteobacteria bacterium ADurb.Bin510]